MCTGTGGGTVNLIQKYPMSETACKTMCSSLLSCAGYTFGSSDGVCLVHGSMTSAPSGWSYSSRSLTTISRSNGASGFSCHLKEGTLFFIALFRIQTTSKAVKNDRKKVNCGKSLIFNILCSNRQTELQMGIRTV